MSKESQLIFLQLRAIEGADNTGNILPIEPPPPSLCSVSCDPVSFCSWDGSVSVRREDLSGTMHGIVFVFVFLSGGASK